LELQTFALAAVLAVLPLLVVDEEDPLPKEKVESGIVVVVVEEMRVEALMPR